MAAIQHRYEFVYLFDVRNGNPNGDPDNGNMPRVEATSHRGFVTDVSLKRKIRNYVSLVKGGSPPFAIYLQEGAILNERNRAAYDALRLQPHAKRLPKESDKARELTAWMCAQFYDIRTFGAVMTTEVNSGQVRGPVQMTFAQSIDPILPQEITITRTAVTHEKDSYKERSMGRKYIVPYGLYRTHGFISASLASDRVKGTGFSATDLDLLFEALTSMFDHDRSAARGEMNAQRLFVFKHRSALGNASAQSLFQRVRVARRSAAPAETFRDYAIDLDDQNWPDGVELIQR